MEFLELHTKVNPVTCHYRGKHKVPRQPTMIGDFGKIVQDPFISNQEFENMMNLLCEKLEIDTNSDFTRVPDERLCCIIEDNDFYHKIECAANSLPTFRLRSGHGKIRKPLLIRMINCLFIFWTNQEFKQISKERQYTCIGGITRRIRVYTCALFTHKTRMIQ